MQNESFYFEVAEIIHPFHFSVKILSEIYSAIQSVALEGKRITLSMIQSRIGPEYDDGASTMTLMTALMRDSDKIDDINSETKLLISMWQRRRMIEACNFGIQEAMKADTDIGYHLSDMENVWKDISVNSQAEPLLTLGQYARRSMENSRTANETGKSPGFDTGLAGLDEILGKIQRGDLGVLGARQGDGKGQALDALVCTPFGFRQMGKLKINDLVSSHDGTSSRIIGIYPLGERQMFDVTFHDGTSTEVTEDHVWLAWIHGRGRHDGSRNQMQGENSRKLFTTAGLIDILAARPSSKIQIPITDPVPFTCSGSYQRCPIPPYSFGALLGDGSFRSNRISFTSADVEIVRRIEGEVGGILLPQNGDNCGRATNYIVPERLKLRDHLKSMGLMEKTSHGKFIPKRYLRATIQERWELLRGLMDTDGTVNVNGDPNFSTVSHQLAVDVAFLARSLGAVANITTRQSRYKIEGEYKQCGVAYNVRIKLKNGADAFHLQRKKEKCNIPQSLYKTIVSIKPGRVAPAQCIKVSHPSSLYLTNDFIVTHNTILGVQLLRRAELYDTACLFELEMKGEQIGTRALANDSGLSVSEIEEGDYNFDQWDELQAAYRTLENSRVYIDDRPKLRIDQIFDRCQALKRSRGLGMVVVDHGRLIQAHGRFADRWEKGAFITGELKSMAKKLDIAVILLSQMTRTSQRDSDPAPKINDFDLGSSVEQDVDWAVGMFRRDRWLKLQKPMNMDSEAGRDWADKMTRHKGLIECRVLKRRRGDDGEMREFVFEGRRGLILDKER